MSIVSDKDIQRVIQESVPGKQVTLAHIIASPVNDIYERKPLFRCSPTVLTRSHRNMDTIMSAPSVRI